MSKKIFVETSDRFRLVDAELQHVSVSYKKSQLKKFPAFDVINLFAPLKRYEIIPSDISALVVH